METAFNIFTLFDDDQSGTVDSSEFLRHIFPEEYVKDQQEILRLKGGCHHSGVERGVCLAVWNVPDLA